jgi:hypothetical protein
VRFGRKEEGEDEERKEEEGEGERTKDRRRLEERLRERRPVRGGRWAMVRSLLAWRLIDLYFGVGVEEWKEEERREAMFSGLRDE